MAQDVQNSSNYHGARSKTNFTKREPSEGKSKKGKKKHNQTGNQNSTWDANNSRDVHSRRNGLAQESWSNEWVTTSRYKRRDEDNSWDNEGEHIKRRQAKTIWGDIEQDFPTIAPNSAPQINVWEQRQQRFEELKSLEPSNENEEENMIRRALELSKLDITQEERRKKIEEEYRLQEELLRNNPSEFSEFIIEESAASGKFSTSNDYATSGNNWNTEEYASAVGTDSSQNADNWDDYAFSDSKNASQYPSSDGWDDYTDYSTQNSHSSSKTNSDSKSLSVCDQKRISKRVVKNSGIWDECDNTENKHSVSKHSNYKSSGVWDNGEIENDQNSKFTAKEKQKAAFQNESQSFSEEPNKKFNKSSEIKSYSKTVGSGNLNMSKVVSMFGGWGSTTNSSLETHVSSTNEAKSITKDDKLLSNKSDSIISSKSSKTASLSTKEIDKSKMQDFELKSEKTIAFGTVKEKKSDSSEETFTTNTSSSHIHNKGVYDSNSFQDLNTTSSNIVNKDNNVVVDHFNRGAFEGKAQPTNLSDKHHISNKSSSESNNFIASSSITKEIISEDVVKNQNSTLGFTDDSTALLSVKNRQNFDTSKRSQHTFDTKPNAEKCSSPITLIDPSKPNDSHQSSELFNHLNYEPHQPVASVEGSVPSSTFHGTENKFQETVSSFQKSDPAQSNPNPFPSVNMQPFSFVPSNPLPPLPLNPMIGAFANPNMYAGVDPMQMHLLMLQNPYLARNLQSIDMYYRSLGMNTCPPNMVPPMLGMNTCPPNMVPPMLGMNSPTFMNPNNNPHENLFIPPPVPISNPVIENPVINPPTSSSNNELKSEQSLLNDSKKSTNSNLVFPESSNESIIDSFLRKKEFCEGKEISIPPPVLANNQTKEDAKSMLGVQSLSENCGTRLKNTSDAENLDVPFKSKSMSAAGSLSSILSACSNLSIDKDDASSGTSECIGWGELTENNAKTSFNKFNDDIDGWGDNYTTKSMGNPSNFDSKRNNSNRQPFRQPNFNRFRK